MLINSSTALVGDKVTLVPYKSHHVPKYHAWMTSAELQELTESEPLRYGNASDCYLQRELSPEPMSTSA